MRLRSDAAAMLARAWDLRRSTLVRQSGTRIAARILASALQALSLLVLARALGAAQFGLFAVGLSLGYVVASVVTWGAQYRVLRSAAEPDPRAIRASLLVLQLSAVCVSTAVAALLLGLDLIVMAGFVGFAVGMADQVNAFGQFDAAGTGHHRHASVMAVQQRAVPAITLIVTLGAFSWAPFLVATALTLLQPLAFSVAHLRPLRPSARALQKGAGYWLYGMAQNTPQLEAPMLGAIASSSVAGLYGIANRIANPLTILSSALSSIFVPEIARARDAELRRHLGNRLIAVSTGYAVVVAVSALWIAPVVVLLAGRTYLPAEPLIAATTVAAGLSAVSQAFNAILIAEGRPFISSVALAVGTCVSLAGLAILASIAAASFLWLAPLLTQTVVLTLFVTIRSRGASQAHRSPDPATAV